MLAFWGFSDLDNLSLLDRRTAETLTANLSRHFQ